MTSTVSPITIAAVLENSYDAISTTVGLIAILLLMFVLVLKEVLRVRGANAGMVAACDLALVPLLPAAAIVLSLRLISLFA